MQAFFGSRNVLPLFGLGIQPNRKVIHGCASRSPWRTSTSIKAAGFKKNFFAVGFERVFLRAGSFFPAMRAP